jgi:putative transposase
MACRSRAAHWSAIAAADFFTTEVWTTRGLVTYDTLFVIELESRRVHLMGSTPHPDDAFMVQVARVMTSADDGVLQGRRIFICDRDTKWSVAFRRILADAGMRVVQTPFRAPNCNAHAERFVRSIKEECLHQVVILGEAHLRRTLTAFMAHYHQERNHQGLDDRLIAPECLAPPGADGAVQCRARLGGLLRYYHRAA